MSTSPPPIDSRSFADLVVQVERLLQRYTDWHRVRTAPELLVGRRLNEDVHDRTTGALIAASGDVVDDDLAQRIALLSGVERVRMVPVPEPGWALVRVFSRLAEVTAERLNRAPQKNLLAFLDLLGLDLRPPQAARAPLTFELAPGRTGDALVPAGTRVAALPAEGETVPVVFETERELPLTYTRLVAAATREPARDRYADHTARLDPTLGDGFSAFLGDAQVMHRLYLGHAGVLGLEGSKDVTLRFGPRGDATESWLQAVRWACWDGGQWSEVPPEADPAAVDDEWMLTLPDVGPVEPTTVHGRSARWLRGTLSTPLPRGEIIETGVGPARTELRGRGVPVDAAFSDDVLIDPARPFHPFGWTVTRTNFYLAADVAFSKPGARVSVRVTLDRTQPARPSEDLVLAWSYWNGEGWQLLGRSSPDSGLVGTSPYDFADQTRAFTHDGAIAFTCPADWTVEPVGSRAHRWLRVHVDEGGFGSPHAFRPPVVATMALDYAWTLPTVDRIELQVSVSSQPRPAEHIAVNQTAADPADDVLPFGERPRVNDMLALASEAALGKPSALVTVDVSVVNERRSQPQWPIPPVRPSSELAVCWEYWNGSAWEALGVGTPLPRDLLLEPVPTVTSAGSLQLAGRLFGSGVVVREVHTGELAVEAVTDGESWTASLPGLSAGPHAFRVTAVQDDEVVDARWAVVQISAPGTAPAAVTIQEPGTLTSEPVVRVRGQVDVSSATALVHNAATDREHELEVTGSGRLSGEVELARGRNDLLVLVRDEDGRWVAAEVATSVRTLAPTAFTDTTWGLTRSGQVRFRLPEDATAREVNGQPGSWIRARITSGGYGSQERYEPAVNPATGEVVTDPITGAPVFRVVPASFRPPLLRSPLLASEYVSPQVAPEQVVSENDFDIRDHVSLAAPEGPAVTPFLPMRDLHPACYLGFERPGAESGFGNRAAVLYFGVAEPLYEGHARDRAGVDAPAVVWEYWNGSSFARLGARDETLGFTRPGLVTFVGPADFRASTELGRTAYWLRARWDGGGYERPPHLRLVLMNTTWARQAVTAGNEVLGSSTGERGQTFRTGQTPVLPGQRVEVREPELPSEVELAAVRADEGPDAVSTTTDASGQVVEVWVRWHQVADFYGSGPRSRHYVLDRLTGELRFGDGQAGLVPPQGGRNVRMSYEYGGGSVGNRLTHDIIQMKTAVPYVVGVTNWEPATGGAERETLDAVGERGPRTLRHRDRAVVASDFEDLALEASSEVARARSIGAAGVITSRNEYARPLVQPTSLGGGAVGQVLVVVVPESTDPRPTPSLRLLGELTDYLRRRATATADVRVTGPDWLRVTVEADVVPDVSEHATEVKTAVLTRLAAYLHPLSGGPRGRGWEFGRQPYRSDLLALVESVPGVSHIRRLQARTRYDQPDQGVGLFLVYSGAHQITMTGPSGGTDGTAPA